MFYILICLLFFYFSLSLRILSCVFLYSDKLNIKKKKKTHQKLFELKILLKLNFKRVIKMGKSYGREPPI